MITEVGKNGEGIFPELTENTIIICTEIGFKNVKEIFCHFEISQEGNPDFDWNTDSENDIIVEHISENEINIKHDSQNIKIFWLRNLNDLTYLRTLDYSSYDIWMSNGKEIYAFSEYKDYNYWNTWEKFLNALIMGRFELHMPEDIYDSIWGNGSYKQIYGELK